MKVNPIEEQVKLEQACKDNPSMMSDPRCMALDKQENMFKPVYAYMALMIIFLTRIAT